jgi:hypothetical protein
LGVVLGEPLLSRFEICGGERIYMSEKRDRAGNFNQIGGVDHAGTAAGEPALVPTVS